MMNDIQHVAADPLDGISQALDRAAAVGIAHLTHGLSPVTMILAATDWALHLACAPGKQLQLEIGRAHVCTPVTNAQFDCRLLPDTKKTTSNTITSNHYK